MSWTKIFPIFDDDILERYQMEASGRGKTATGKTAMADLFAVDSIHNEKKVEHVVATRLFLEAGLSG